MNQETLLDHAATLIRMLEEGKQPSGIQVGTWTALYDLYKAGGPSLQEVRGGETLTGEEMLQRAKARRKQKEE